MSFHGAKGDSYEPLLSHLHERRSGFVGAIYKRKKLKLRSVSHNYKYINVIDCVKMIDFRERTEKEGRTYA